MLLEALGINFHHAGVALMASYIFTFWFIIGVLGVALWNWIFHRKTKMKAEQAGAGYPPQSVGSPDP